MLESFGKSFASGNRTRRSATSRNRCSTFIFMHWRPQLRSHRLHSGFASDDSAAPATGAALTHTSEGALERGERVDLIYDSAADRLRLRPLELPTAQTEEVDSNAVIDWASDRPLATGHSCLLPDHDRNPVRSSREVGNLFSGLLVDGAWLLLRTTQIARSISSGPLPLSARWRSGQRI